MATNWKVKWDYNEIEIEEKVSEESLQIDRTQSIRLLVRFDAVPGQSKTVEVS